MDETKDLLKFFEDLFEPDEYKTIEQLYKHSEVQDALDGILLSNKGERI